MRYRFHVIAFLVTLLLSGFCTAFTHDALGRMTSDGLAGTQISYNVQDLPVCISKGDSIRVTFKYLADGTKLEMTDSTGAGLLYRGPFIYRTTSTGPNGTTVRTLESVPFEGGRLTAGGTLRYITDHLGSVRAVLNAGGSPLAIDEYEPYGAWRAVPGSDGVTSASQTPAGVSLRYRFTGKEDLIPDWTLPYTDFGARLYSPALRRWLSPDALSEKFYGINPYVYCAGNPVNLVDTDGRIIDTFIDAASLSIGVKSFISNVKQGKVGAAVVDGIGIVADVASLATPFVSAGAGVAIKAVRGADKAVDAVKVANKVGDVSDAAKGVNEGRSLTMTSRAARRKAMRDAGIPTTLQPSSQSINSSGREYRYDIPSLSNGRRQFTVQQQTKDRNHTSQHWEAGEVKQRDGQTSYNKYGRPIIKNGTKTKEYYGF